MSSFKFGIVCAILIFSSQVQGSQLEVTSNHGDDYVDYQLISQTLGGVLKVVSFVVQTVIGPVENTIKSFSTNLDFIQKTSVQVATNVLNGLKNLISKQLTFAETHGANEDAKAVSTCLKANGNEIVTLIVSYWDRMTQCVNPSIQNTTNQISPILDKLNSTFNGLDKIAGILISECDDLNCLTSVGLQIVQLFAQFSDDVAPQWADFVSALSAFISSFVTCHADDLPAWKKEVIVELNKISTCIRT